MTTLTDLKLTQKQILTIWKLLGEKQKEQVMKGEYTIFNRSTEMELYQLFLREYIK